MQNPHYDKVKQQFGKRKDSIFEQCKVISYDPTTMTAEIQGYRSLRRVSGVPVLFPAMCMDTGVITPPAPHSMGLLLYGADNECFLLPAQMIAENQQYKGGKMKSTHSPSFFHPSMSLADIKGGEALLRSLSHAYVYLKNTGEVELGTLRLHKVKLVEKDGSFRLQVERILTQMKGYQSYIGPISSSSSLHHKKEEYGISENPALNSARTTRELVERINAGEQFHMAPPSFKKEAEQQTGNVIDGGTLQYCRADGAPLFSRLLLFSGGQEVSRIEESKKGSRFIEIKEDTKKMTESTKAEEKVLTVEDEEYSTTLTIRPGSITATFVDKLGRNIPSTKTETWGI